MNQTETIMTQTETIMTQTEITMNQTETIMTQTEEKINNIQLSYKSSNTIPKRYINADDIKERYVLVFDTETTGLPKNSWANFQPYYYSKNDKKYSSSEESDFPHIVQLSFILYDNYENKILISNNELIKIPENVEITEGSYNIHKISKEQTQSINNREINFALNDFMQAFYMSDIVVAHNISFDRNLILVELLRCSKEKNLCNDSNIYTKYLNDFYYNKKEYCTCNFGSDECKILKINKLGNPYYAKPKLQYLYNYLFNNSNIDTNKLHDAFTDLLLCFRCFCKLRYNQDIYYIDNKIKILIDDLAVKPVLRRSERIFNISKK